MSEFISFTDFLNYVKENLLTGWHEDQELEVKKVQKNNGTELTAITVAVQTEESMVVPTLYMEDVYNLYLQGMTLEDTLLWIRAQYEMAEEMLVDMGVELDIVCYEKMCDKIVFRIVNYEKNKELIKDCPFIRVHDLAVTFRCVMFTNLGTVTTTLITDELMEEWKIDRDTLLMKAQENTERLFPPMVQSMNAILTGEHEDRKDEKGGLAPDFMYVMTNDKGLFGATTLVYDGLLEEFAEMIGGSYYILPSSLHELIFVPVKYVESCHDLLDLVNEVNKEVVSMEDYLSDSVYFYNKGEKHLDCFKPKRMSSFMR